VTAAQPPPGDHWSVRLTAGLSASCASVAASSSAETAAASTAPIRWKISRAFRSICAARSVWPAARAQRPRPASAWASVQGLAMARACSSACWWQPLSLREVAAGPVQRPFLVERLGLTGPVAEVAEDAQGLVQQLGGGRVITSLPPQDPESAEDPGLAEPVADVTADAQDLLRQLGRAPGTRSRVCAPTPDSTTGTNTTPQPCPDSFDTAYRPRSAALSQPGTPLSHRFPVKVGARPSTLPVPGLRLLSLCCCTTYFDRRSRHTLEYGRAGT
jgi:hypothetical protein